MAPATIYGLPSSFFVYTIATASLMEAIIFITLYAQVLADINPNRYRLVADICTFALILNSIRFVIAIVAFIGQYKETIKTLTVFLGFTLIGIFANIAVGLYAMLNPWTEIVGLATVAVAVLHIIYLVIGVCVFRVEYKKTSIEPPRMPLVPVHVPHAIPGQTTINIPPTDPSLQMVSGQQHFHNPNMTPAPDMSYSHVPPLPPSYDESTPSGAAEFPSKKW